MTTSPSFTAVSDCVYRLDTLVTGTQMPLAIYALKLAETAGARGEASGWLLVDTGCVGMIRDQVLPALRDLVAQEPSRLPSRVAAAVVTHAHADHFGGNAELLSEHPGCSIYVHPLDASWAADPATHVRESYDSLLPEYVTPDAVKAWVAALLGPPAPVVRLEPSQRFRLADGSHLETLHLPGHSRGHIGLWTAEHGVLLCGDAILGDGQWAGGRRDAIPSYLDVEQYRASIARVRELKVEALCTSHFGTLDAARAETFCDQSEAFVMELERAVIDLLANDGPQAARGWPLAQLTAAALGEVAPEVAPSVTAAFSVQAHLDELHADGRARAETRAGIRYWRLA